MEMALGMVIDCSVGMILGVTVGVLVGMVMGAVLSQKLKHERVRRSSEQASGAGAPVGEHARGGAYSGEPIAPEGEQVRGGAWPEVVYVSEAGSHAHAHPNCSGLSAARRVRALKGCKHCTDLLTRKK